MFLAGVTIMEGIYMSAGEVFLINPKRRRGKGGRFVKSTPAKRRTRARTAARKPAKRKYRRNPAAAAARSTYKANPRRRARSAPRKRRSYRRNPAPRLNIRTIMKSVQSAALGAGGSLLTDAAFTYIPLPAIAKAGNIGLVTRALMAFGVGWLGSFAVGGSRAVKMTEGALTVQIANLAKAQISSRFLPLAGDEELGYVSAGMIGEYLSGDAGTFAIPDGSAALGEYLSEYDQDIVAADEYQF